MWIWAILVLFLQGRHSNDCFERFLFLKTLVLVGDNKRKRGEKKKERERREREREKRDMSKTFVCQ